MDMAGTDGCNENDLTLVGREFQIRGEVLRKERSAHLGLEVKAGREPQRSIEERVLTLGLILTRLRRWHGSDLWTRM